MKLNTGKVAFLVEFDNGDKQNIYFNPNDRGITKRLENFEEALNKRIKAMDFEKYKTQLENDKKIDLDLNNPEDIMNLSLEDMNLLKERANVIDKINQEYNDAVKKELDIVFDSDVSNVLFKYCEPFDICVIYGDDGKEQRDVYVQQVVRWFLSEMGKYAKQNHSAMEKHISKYVK